MGSCRGCGFLCFFALFTIDWLLLAVAAIAAVALSLTHRAPLAPLGAISGAGLSLLKFHSDNRSGPRAVCTRTGAGTECTTTFMNPTPLLLSALVLLLLGCLLYATIPPATDTRFRNG